MKMYEKFYTTVGVGAHDDPKKRHVNKPNKRFNIKTFPKKVLVHLLQKVAGFKGE